MKHMRPMDAVAALYSDGHQEQSEAIIASLSRAVFDESGIRSAGAVQRVMARATYRFLKWTTSRRVGEDSLGEEVMFRNPVLERSGHPYARSLMASSRKEIESLVEGGDPMNGPYMMIAPEIRKAGTTWDRIFFNSVLGKDVQLRFIRETQATYDAARQVLNQGGAVRLKAMAAGTGLSMILAYERLLRDGFEPGQMTASINDREASNTEKTRRLLGKLPLIRGAMTDGKGEGGISASTEDAFESGTTGVAGYDVVTAVGILEYLQGFTCDTTERRLRLPEPEERSSAMHLAERFGELARDGASVIVNTCRPHASTRILEVFGKRFDYRETQNLSALMATASFQEARLVGSGAIYDVVVYRRRTS